MNAPTGKLFVDAVTTFAIDGVEVGQAKTQSHGHLHAQLEPPVNLVGTRKLDIVVRHPQIEAFRTSVDVEIVRPGEAAAWPEATSRRSEGARTTEEEWEGELRVRLLPTNGELPRGLSSVAYLLLTDAEGKPVQGAIKFEKVEGMLDGELAREYRTDALGLAQIELTPVTSLKIEVAATDADGPPEAADSAPRTGEGSLWVDAVVSQFSMRPTQSLAVPGLPVEALVSSLHRSGGVLVDLYESGRWVAADAYGIAPNVSGVRAVVPEDVRADVVRMQVYQDLFEQGTAWDVRWFARAPSQAPSQCSAALGRVLAVLASNDSTVKSWAASVLAEGVATDPARAAGRCSLWLEAALRAMPVHFEPSPILVNSQQTDRDELDAWREQMQSKLIVATTLVLVVGFLFILLLVLQGVQRSQRHAALIREVEIETASDSQLTDAPSFDVEKWLVALRSAIVILTIFTFGAALIMLLGWL